MRLKDYRRTRGGCYADDVPFGRLTYTGSYRSPCSAGSFSGVRFVRRCA